jgi:hypothetical protein
MEVSQANLTVFLDLLHHRPIPNQVTWLTLEKVLAISTKFDCGGILEKIVVLACSRVDQAPWNIFRLASRAHAPALAKIALKAMSGDNTYSDMTLYSMNASDCAGIRMSYVIGLARAFANHPYGDGGKYRDQSYNGLDWSAIGEEFRPTV